MYATLDVMPHLHKDTVKLIFFPHSTASEIILALCLLSRPEDNSQFIMFVLPQILHFYKRLA